MLNHRKSYKQSYILKITVKLKRIKNLKKRNDKKEEKN
jgi:hypothetical protein